MPLIQTKDWSDRLFLGHFFGHYAPHLGKFSTIVHHKLISNSQKLVSSCILVCVIFIFIPFRAHYFFCPFWSFRTILGPRVVHSRSLNGKTNQELNPRKKVNVNGFERCGDCGTHNAQGSACQFPLRDLSLRSAGVCGSSGSSDFDMSWMGWVVLISGILSVYAAQWYKKPSLQDIWSMKPSLSPVCFALVALTAGIFFKRAATAGIWPLATPTSTAPSKVGHPEPGGNP